MNWLRAISYIAVLLLLIPVLALLYYGLGPFRSPGGLTIGIWQSIGLSLMASALAAAVDFLLFTPLAYHLARSEDTFLESLVDIPVGVPHPIIGVALLIIDSPLTPTGRFLLGLGVNFFDTVLGLIVALVVVSAPIYIRSIQPFMESRDPSAEEFVMGLGASRFRTLFAVVLPESGRGVASATLISMSRALGEFGSLSIIAFYVLQYPFYGVSPASVTIFQLFNGALPGGLDAAVTASAAMVLVALPITVAGHYVRRRER